MIHPNSARNILGANERRSKAVALVTVEKCRTASQQIMDMPAPRTARQGRLIDQYLDALWLRINNPGLSLAQVAAREGWSKDVYASRLRRALRFAGRKAKP